MNEVAELEEYEETPLKAIENEDVHEEGREGDPLEELRSSEAGAKGYGRQDLHQLTPMVRDVVGLIGETCESLEQAEITSQNFDVGELIGETCQSLDDPGITQAKPKSHDLG